MGAKILIGADIVPTKSNYSYFKNGDVDSLIGTELKELLDAADFTIFNLEVPLTNSVSPIDKAGPNLIAPTDTIDGLKAINPHFFTLANNHILDQGRQGLDSTIDVLKSAGINYSGVGTDLEDAQKPYIDIINGIKIGIYCCAEHEYSIATEYSAGANPFEPLESLEHVADLAKQCDYVIVLYHGGKEHYRYPSPYLQRVCRKFVDKGAGIVVCQHSHCIGSMENWKDGTIIYGQGNFLFDHSKSEFWQTGLLIGLDLEKNIKGEVAEKLTYYPLYKQNAFTRLAHDSEKEKILADFYSRSEELDDPHKIAEHYSSFADSFVYEYLNAFYGKKSVLFRAINKLSGYRFNKWAMDCRFGKKEKIVIRNFIECEAHRELAIEGLTGEKR